MKFIQFFHLEMFLMRLQFVGSRVPFRISIRQIDFIKRRRIFSFSNEYQVRFSYQRREQSLQLWICNYLHLEILPAGLRKRNRRALNSSASGFLKFNVINFRPPRDECKAIQTRFSQPTFHKI